MASYFVYGLRIMLFVFPMILAGVDIIEGSWTSIPYTVLEYYFSLLHPIAFVVLYIWPARFLFDHSFRCQPGSPGEKGCRLVSYMWLSTVILHGITKTVAWRWKRVELNAVALLGLTVAEVFAFAGIYMLARGFGWPEYHYLTVTLLQDIRDGQLLLPLESESEGDDVEKGNVDNKNKVLDSKTDNNTDYANEKLHASQQHTTDTA